MDFKNLEKFVDSCGRFITTLQHNQNGAAYAVALLCLVALLVVVLKGGR